MTDRGRVPNRTCGLAAVVLSIMAVTACNSTEAPPSPTTSVPATEDAVELASSRPTPDSGTIRPFAGTDKTGSSDFRWGSRLEPAGDEEPFNPAWVRVPRCSALLPQALPLRGRNTSNGP